MTIANFFLHPLTPSSCQVFECSCSISLAVIFLHLRVAVGTISVLLVIFFTARRCLSTNSQCVCIPNDCLQRDSPTHLETR